MSGTVTFSKYNTGLEYNTVFYSATGNSKANNTTWTISNTDITQTKLVSTDNNVAKDKTKVRSIEVYIEIPSDIGTTSSTKMASVTNTVDTSGLYTNYDVYIPQADIDSVKANSELNTFTGFDITNVSGNTADIKIVFVCDQIA